jgi:hypothetical protein
MLAKKLNKNKLMKCIIDKSQHSQQIMYLLNTQANTISDSVKKVTI